MNKKELEAQYNEMFDASDVVPEIIETKRGNEIHIKLKKQRGRFNMIIILLVLEGMCEKLRHEMGMLDEAEGDEH